MRIVDEIFQYTSAIVLVLANIVPLIGIYLFGWSEAEILLLYWSESAIIGFFNVVKMLLAKGMVKSAQELKGWKLQGMSSEDMESIASRLSKRAEAVAEARKKEGKALSDQQTIALASMAMKAFMIPFFILHYGGFMLGHLVFLIAFFVPQFSFSLLMAVFIGFVSLSISHSYSFFSNYISKKEYENANLAVLMFQPYTRIILMHVAIVFGAFINTPLVILIVGKIVVDLMSHFAERKQVLTSLMQMPRGVE
jgi:hypothetical protein